MTEVDTALGVLPGPEQTTHREQLGPAATTGEQPIEVVAESTEGEDDEFDRARWVQGTIAPELSQEAQ